MKEQLRFFLIAIFAIIGIVQANASAILSCDIGDIVVLRMANESSYGETLNKDIDSGRYIIVSNSWSCSDESEVRWLERTTTFARVQMLKPGKYTISQTLTYRLTGSNKTYTYNGRYEITVKEIMVSRISLSPSSVTKTVGESFYISETVYPSNATNKSVSWTSDDFYVASVSNSGYVTVKSAGETKIRCFANDRSGVSAACSVTVKGAPVSVTKISLSPTSKEIREGETFTISATVYPSNATDKSVSWKSGDTTVATVDSYGKVTAKKAGNAIITCTSNSNSSIYAECDVTVAAQVKEGETVEANSLKYRIYPSGNTAVLVRQLNSLSGTITLPERISYKDTNYTVTEIGDSAFWQQSNVTNINISSTIKKIGDYAFSRAKSLVSIKIPDNVESIGREPFNYCNSLESLYIGSGLKNMGIYFCYSCPKLRFISVSEDNRYFKTEEGILYSKDSRIVYKVPQTMTSVELPHEVEKISNGCFAFNTLIEQISLPYELRTICSQAFEGCTAIKFIDIPDKVKYIYSSAFKECNKLETIKIGKNVAEIGPNAFVKSDFYWSYEYEVYVRASVPPIIDRTTFGSHIGTLYVPLGCKGAYEGADYWRNSQKIVEYDFDGIEEIVLSDESLEMTVSDTYTLTYTITPADAKSKLIWTSSDSKVATVENGVITAVGAGTATITCTADDGNRVSASCQVTVDSSVLINSLRYRLYPYDHTAVVIKMRGLGSVYETVSIPERISHKNEEYLVTEVGDSAFLNQYITPVINLPSSIKTIGAFAFGNMHCLDSIEIPDNVESIGSSAFTSCYQLKSVYIGSGLKSLGTYPFWLCQRLVNIRVSDKNQYFTTEGDILYSKDYKVVYKVPEKMSKITLHPSVELISNGCFGENKSIENIDLPAGLITLEDNAFAYCRNLKSIDIPDNVTDIYSGAFKACETLQIIKLGKKVKQISGDAFATGSNYSEVYIRAVVPPTIEESTFDNYAATLYVPVGSKNAYANASYWNKFKSIVERDFDGVEKIELSDESLEMNVGDTHTLTYTITPADAKSKLNWTSSDSEVATVENGVVTAVSEGSATITCTAEDGSGVSASCSVMVLPYNPVSASEIEGNYQFFLGDFFRGDDSLGMIAGTGSIEIDGKSALLEIDVLNGLDISAAYNEKSGSLIFKQKVLPEVTVDGESYFCRFEPFVCDEDGQIILTDYFISYDKTRDSFVFPAEHGFRLAAYADSEYTQYEGCFAMYIVSSLMKDTEAEGKWIDYDTATYTDGWMLPALEYDPKDYPWTVSVQQNVENPNLFRISDPYAAEGCPIRDYVVGKGNIVFDLSDNENIMVPTGHYCGITSGQNLIEATNGLGYNWQMNSDYYESYAELQDDISSWNEASTYDIMTGTVSFNDCKFMVSGDDNLYIWTDKQSMMNGQLVFDSKRPGAIIGDADDNGKVDIGDAVVICNHYVGKTDDINQGAADVTGDGRIDVQDALAVCNIYLGKNNLKKSKQLTIKRNENQKIHDSRSLRLFRPDCQRSLRHDGERITQSVVY